MEYRIPSPSYHCAEVIGFAFTCGGELLPVVPRPVRREIVVGIRLQIHVAEGQPGRVGDGQHGQHPFRGRPLAESGGTDCQPVDSFVILKIEGRRHIPVPLVLAGGFLDAIALGEGLVQGADRAGADRDPAARPELVLGRDVILLSQVVGPADRRVVVVPPGRIESVPDPVAVGQVEIRRGGERPLFAERLRIPWPFTQEEAPSDW